MKDKIRVLVSNLPLPYQGIGSWTFEFNYFLEKNKFFDFVLSPNKEGDSSYIFSAKRKWFPGSQFVRQKALTDWVAKDYLSELLKIGQKKLPVQILVIDDQALLEAVCTIKTQLPQGSEIIFYYHGHALKLNPSLAHLTDKVFFLTEAGYLESLNINNEFTPEVHIVGNGVSSVIFHPLVADEKTSLRESMGFERKDIIICWMANSRPVKGIHLFGKLIPKLLELDPRIKIVTIGHEPNTLWENDRLFQIGKKTSQEVAKYLQLSDYYFFTSLWKEGFGLSLVEAIKCGNFILCSDNGGIKDVVSTYPNVHLIDKPNILNSWIEAFKEQLLKPNVDTKQQFQFSDFEEFYSLDSWEKRLKRGLA
ncbi:glycosyltransferase [Algoriphagus chordae]|uniref:Glycosyltransferase involved in cell wall biosynthesis n=1 Tax=Algoriphagus chordae TaxID=237019 RepID=A0A2W7QHF5_9BACT|nr:glycosyltransferase [Algoriphagus chordae]PZX47683.1 glycosyltransferase involved in cell wall biosynthesis [Algoriphagus chordae]